MSIQSPLAERMRPKSLDDYRGQDHLLKEGASLRKALDSGIICEEDIIGNDGADVLANEGALHKGNDPYHRRSLLSNCRTRLP